MRLHKKTKVKTLFRHSLKLICNYSRKKNAKKKKKIGGYKMKNLKKVTTIGAIVLAMGVTGASGFAASMYKTPGEAAAGVTGKTLESLVLQRQETKESYGAIAAEEGKLDEFKKEVLEIKKEHINTQVKEGRLSQEKADEMIKAIEENQVDCEGQGSELLGKSQGLRFGSNGLGQGAEGFMLGQAKGQRKGKSQGQNKGQGQRQGGMRLQDGSGYTPSE